MTRSKRKSCEAQDEVRNEAENEAEVEVEHVKSPLVLMEEKQSPIIIKEQSFTKKKEGKEESIKHDTIRSKYLI
jgi:hypothetical protein